MRSLQIGLVGILGLVVVLAGSTAAQGEQPDAILSLSQGSVAAGIGFNWGSGTLTYQGKEYAVKVGGLSVGDVGVTRASATGKVYHLGELSQFSGTYTAVGVGGTLGGGGGVTAMRNQNGVVIELTGVTQGLNIKLSVEGVRLTLAN
jgi:hypothetical protein